MNRAAGKYVTIFIFWLWGHWATADATAAPNPAAPTMATTAMLLRHQSPHVVIQKSPDNPGLVSLTFYLDGQVTGTLVYRNGLPFEGMLIEPADDGPHYLVHYLMYHGNRIYIARKELYPTESIGKSYNYPLKTWYYHFDRNRPNTLRQMDQYRPQSALVLERHLFDEDGNLAMTASFEYGGPALDGVLSDPEGELPSVKRMSLRNARGELLQDYTESVEIDLGLRLRQAGLPSSEIRRRKAVAADTHRIPLLVFDSGIDIGHPDLAHKMWRNPDDPINGLDDDGNGLVDDFYGISDNPLGHPVEDLRLPRFGLPEFSHGTFVASVAVQDRDDVAIMAVSEITTINSRELFDRAQRFIKAHNVRFTNMSFVFDKLILDFGASFDRARQLKDLIANTPDTLHVVASGNGTSMGSKGVDIDLLRETEDLIPAMLSFQNTLVVGALATHELKLKDYPHYRLAEFSNVGTASVDILAPGYQMRGARLGGGDMVADGTSFAAPYLFNHGVMNLVRANPNLDIYQIKEIILKTAYIPDLAVPFPVRSGGILHPQRASAVAQFLYRKPHHTIEEAVLAVRRQEKMSLTGEPNDDAYFLALQEFWASRGMVHNDLWIAERAH